MSDVRMPPKAGWPPFPWKDSGWWFGVAAMVATLAFFLSPEMIDLPWRRKLSVSLALLASPLVLLMLRYAKAVGWVLGQRVWHYPRLYQMLEHLVGTSDTLSRQLAESFGGRSSFEILRVHWFRGQEEMYLLIKKKPGKQPEIGATFLVLDEEDRRLMAVSKMMDSRSNGYYAKVTEHVDPVWLGEVRGRDLPELPPPSAVSAYLCPKREEIRNHGDGE